MYPLNEVKHFLKIEWKRRRPGRAFYFWSFQVGFCSLARFLWMLPRALDTSSMVHYIHIISLDWLCMCKCMYKNEIQIRVGTPWVCTIVGYALFRTRHLNSVHMQNPAPRLELSTDSVVLYLCISVYHRTSQFKTFCGTNIFIGLFVPPSNSPFQRAHHMLGPKKHSIRFTYLYISRYAIKQSNW